MDDGGPRIIVAGTSGAGKTTVARALARRLDLPVVEIDSLFHGPGWVRRPEFEVDVAAFAAGPAWVVEWQYRDVRALLAGRATHVVWLDLPRRTVVRQVVARTVRRRVLREELWNGNREGPLWRALVDRDHIVRWAWRTHARTPGMVDDLLRARADLSVVRLRSRREVDAWLAGDVSAALAAAPPAGSQPRAPR